MIYTILGAMIGGGSSFLLCRLFKISDSTSTYAPSEALICVTLGTLIGMGAGFGYGTSQLLSGTHIVQTLKSE
jgi:hypothetical protein